MPIASANAKSLSVEPPNRSSVTIGTTVMSVVLIERVRVSQTDTLTICENEFLRSNGVFSRTRSKTMMVSYSE
jgi:hypothetical protein